jgi:parallel beta-helix repeat protein
MFVVPPPTGNTAADTPAVAAVINAMNTAGGYGVLAFQLGTYQVDSNSLVVRDCSNFAILGRDGTTITQAPNSSSNPNNTTGDLFVVADSSNFIVRGVTFDGLRDSLSPLTVLSANAASGQPSVTVGAGEGTNYLAGQRASIFGGLYADGGDAATNTLGADANKKDSVLVIDSVTPGGGAGGGDLITFTTNLANSYTAEAGAISDAFGPYAANGAYITSYQSASANEVAGRSLSSEDQQNALHLLNCQRFLVDSVVARNVWESGIKCGTGFATSSLGDGCEDGVITNCTCLHGYDQGISLWISNQISVIGNLCESTGWAGISMSHSDHCVVTGNIVSNTVYRVPDDTGSGSGICVEGGVQNRIVANEVTDVWSNAVRCSPSPLSFGINTSSCPTLSSFLEANTAAGASVEVSTSSWASAGETYSIVDGERTERVEIASVIDDTHVTFADATRFEHASGVAISASVAEGNLFEGNDFYSTLTGHGMSLAPAVRSIVRGNTIYRAGTQAAVFSGVYALGIFLGQTSFGSQSVGGEGSLVEGNTVGLSQHENILIENSNGHRVIGNELTGTCAGGIPSLHIMGAMDLVVEGNRIHDNANGPGILIESNDSVTPVRLTINANLISRTANEGIITLAGDQLTISGNVVTSCKGDAGINLRNTTRSIVSGNQCTSNQNDGINLETNGSGCSYCVVRENVCRDDGTGYDVNDGGTFTQQHGIVEVSGSNSNVFERNIVDSNASSQLTVVGAESKNSGNIVSGVIGSLS